MADVIVRSGNGGQVQPKKSPQAGPIRTLRDLRDWDPFQEVMPSWPASRLPVSFAPAFEVKETSDALVIKADVPGVNEQDLEVSLTGNRLTVSGKREEDVKEQSETYYQWERSYGAFTRSFALPAEVDANHVKAELKAGVLRIEIPRKPGAAPKQIDIKVTDRSSKA